MASIKAVGNSQVTQGYSFNDSSAKAAILNYRLKITDKDGGGIKYSDVILLRVNEEVVIKNINPNPFSNLINIEVDITRDESIAIMLKDMQGRKIKTIISLVKAGSNRIILTNLISITSGPYILETYSGTKKLDR